MLSRLKGLPGPSRGLQGLDLAEPTEFSRFFRTKRNEVCTAGCVAGDNVTLQPLSCCACLEGSFGG